MAYSNSVMFDYIRNLRNVQAVVVHQYLALVRVHRPSQRHARTRKGLYAGKYGICLWCIMRLVDSWYDWWRSCGPPKTTSGQESGKGFTPPKFSSTYNPPTMRLEIRRASDASWLRSRERSNSALFLYE